MPDALVRERSARLTTEKIKEQYWHDSCGTEQKLADVKITMNKMGIHFPTWNQALKVRLGGVLCDAVMSVCNWFETIQLHEKGKKRLFLVPTAELASIKDKILEQAELYSAEPWPMLIPPKDWTQERSLAGGYVLNRIMEGRAMVRRGDPTIEQGKIPVQFLNKIQRTAYRLNPFTVEVAEILYEHGVKVGKKPKFIPVTATEELPSKPPDIAENAASRKDYCRRAAEVQQEPCSDS